MQNKRIMDPIEATYFQNLSESAQGLVRDLLMEAINQVEGWKYGPEDILENIECEARDGFIPSSYNHGGILARQFTDLGSLYGSGTRVAHKKAQAEIERQIEYSLECARNKFYEDHESYLIGIGIERAEDVGYCTLIELGASKLAEEFSEYENESMTGDQDSIMFEARFMFHGFEDGKYSASVSCAVNTEGPYHRTRIPWAPHVFCEGAKEVEIEWTTDAELERELKAAILETSRKVF